MLPQNTTSFGIPFNSIFGDTQTTQTQSIQNNTQTLSIQNNSTGSLLNYTLPEGLQIHRSNNTDIITAEYNTLCKKYSISTVHQNEQGNRSVTFKQKN